jgi:hypothetical protein
MSTPESFPYHLIRARWVAIVQSDGRHELTAAHFLLYMALMHRDWRKAFSPIRRPSKLANGFKPYYSADRALWWVHSAYWKPKWLDLFDGILTPEMLAEVLARLPKPNDDFADQLPDAPYVEVIDES